MKKQHNQQVQLTPQPKLIHIYVLYALDQMREEYRLKNARKN